MTIQQPVPEHAQNTAEYLDQVFTEVFGECVVTVKEDDDVPIIIPPLDESDVG